MCAWCPWQRGLRVSFSPCSTLRRAFMSKVVKYIKSELKARCAFWYQAEMSRKWSNSQSGGAAWSRRLNPGLSSLFCRHQNAGLHVTVQNRRTGEHFQVLVWSWDIFSRFDMAFFWGRKWRKQVYKSKLPVFYWGIAICQNERKMKNLDKWKIAVGIKIKYASLRVWQNPHSQPGSLKLMWVNNRWDPAIQARNSK